MISKNLLYHSKIISYYLVGEGEPLFLLHGYQADSRIWNKLVPLLKEKFMLIIPDFPGHGKSDLVQSANTMEFLAEVVFKLFLSLGLKGASFAGHSMGGYVALAFAEKYPEHVEALYLINSHPFKDSMTRILARTRETELIENGKKHILLISFVSSNFYEGNLENLEDVIKQATQISLEQPEQGMIADLAGMMVRPDRMVAVLGKRYPVKIITGAHDNKIPFPLIDKMQNKGLDVHLIDDCGHLSILEKPDELSRILLD